MNMFLRSRPKKGPFFKFCLRSVRAKDHVTYLLHEIVLDMNCISSYRKTFLAKRIFLPVNIVDLLGEQLLTEVKPFLKITLRFANAFMFGVLPTVLL